jgi:hypothetical protein
MILAISKLSCRFSPPIVTGSGGAQVNLDVDISSTFVAFIVDGGVSIDALTVTGRH